MTDFVYPGALHTRFHHALGAMHLMQKALDNFRQKGHYIYDAEAEAALIAILLHDIGHGPFSHTMEYTLLRDTPHEEISLILMEHLNKKYKGSLSLAIEIFKGQYDRKFFHELVSSQLDMDRLDYLRRDSYFTGVIEGSTGTERILKMMNIVDDHLVVEEKGIYSIESFLSSRRLMYWQVYLHKTAVCAERMLKNVIDRARGLVQDGVDLDMPPSLRTFFLQSYTIEDFRKQEVLDAFVALDDYDIWSALKTWMHHPDTVLRTLSTMLVQRKLLRIRMQGEPVNADTLDRVRTAIMETYQLSEHEASFLMGSESISNSAYVQEGTTIKILKKSGEIQNITDAADLPNIMAMSKIVTKHYLCYPKNISL